METPKGVRVLDVADKAKEQFLDCLYSNEEVNTFLLDLGYDLIIIDDVEVPAELKGDNAYTMKRAQMFDNYNKHTLFISLREDNTVSNVYHRKVHVGSLTDKEEVEKGSSSGFGSLIILLFIVCLGIGGMVSCVNWVSDDSDTGYYYDTDDKDMDGDVDYDDVEKYLEDSLEEDKNDGDDW